MSDFAIKSSRATKPAFYKAPHPPNMTPLDFQYAGAEYCTARDHALLGDAPGLGKTIEALLVDNAIESGRTLCVVPASLRLNWEKEIMLWSDIENVSTHPILTAKDGINPNADFNIISYSLSSNPATLAAIMDLRWDHTILDEAHYLKDPRGNNRTKAVCGWMDAGTYRKGIADVSGRITMASGTILPNQPDECYNAIRLLNHAAIDYASLAEFRENYYDIGEGMVRKQVIVGEGTPHEHMESKLVHSDNVRNVPVRLDDLQDRLRKYIMVRRLKEHVLHDLPTMQWNLFPLAVTADMRKAMRHEGWKEAEKLYDLDPESFNRGIPVDGAISTARRLLGEAKASSVAGYIEDMLRSGTRKIVVGAWHHNVLDELRIRLTKYGLVYMDGSTSTRAKQSVVDAFQTDPKIQIILGQIIPLGEGWTLTAAQDVVDAEPDWVPGKNDQLLDRINRIGQLGDYTIGHVPVVPNSLDERIVGTAVAKAQNIHKALDAQ